MPKFRDIASALRVAALLLLTVCLCLGLGRFGAAAAFAASGVSDAPCPCAGAPQGSQAQAREAAVDSCDDPCDEAGAASCAQGDPCQHDCSDTCPTCACSLGGALAVLPFGVTTDTITWAVAGVFVSIDAPARGSRTRVFRPPRTLA